MPRKPAAPTAHTMRIDQVRPRVVKAIKSIEARGDNRPQNITPYGIFTRKCSELAAREGRKWFGTPRTRGEVPLKDATSSVRRFAEGKQGLSFERLDVCEMVCIEIEKEERDARLARQESTRERTLHTAPAPQPAPIVSLVPSEPPYPLWSDDPEIDAMSKVKNAIDPLDDAARARVLEYMTKRYGA